GVAVMALFGRASIVSGIAAVTTDKKQTEQVDVVDKEVKEWLDEGHSIPAEVKYATLSGTGHLWELDSTDLSDGKVELIGNGEKCTISGNALRSWLKTQFFYKDDPGVEDSRVKFERPRKKKAF
ncbi:MAG: hypothetical protein K6G42_05235, partial [Lachnospiraceae bacterium]|nr:hypothetical protein [Lachnospiraceae bacterium]